MREEPPEVRRLFCFSGRLVGHSELLLEDQPSLSDTGRRFARTMQLAPRNLLSIALKFTWRRDEAIVEIAGIANDAGTPGPQRPSRGAGGTETLCAAWESIPWSSPWTSTPRST
jgi:hypothetical protein